MNAIAVSKAVSKNVMKKIEESIKSNLFLEPLVKKVVILMLRKSNNLTTPVILEIDPTDASSRIIVQGFNAFFLGDLGSSPGTLNRIIMDVTSGNSMRFLVLIGGQVIIWLDNIWSDYLSLEARKKRDMSLIVLDDVNSVEL